MSETARIRIRHASKADIESVRRCLAVAFAPYQASYTQAAFEDTVSTLSAMVGRFQEMRVLVAQNELGEIVGTIAHRIGRSGDGHLRGMAVDPQFQGSDIAALLLRSAEVELKALGCTRATLDTTQPLKRAIRFYRRHGYEATGRVSDFFGMPLFEYAKHL